MWVGESAQVRVLYLFMLWAIALRGIYESIFFILQKSI